MHSLFILLTFGLPTRLRLEIVPSMLLSLQIDSLHFIASFLSAYDGSAERRAINR
jgi:hypothetical protein